MTGLVLIVGANVETQRMLSMALAFSDFRTAAHAPQAFATAMKECPELIVANLAMAGVDGFDLVQQLKHEPATAFIPVLGITGQPYPELQQHARSAGFDALLILPVPASTLGDVARLLIARAALMRERSSRAIDKSATLRARAGALQRDTAAEVFRIPPHPSSTEHQVESARCLRCGSNTDTRHLRTTTTSVIYCCGVCNSQFRRIFNKGRHPG